MFVHLPPLTARPDQSLVETPGLGPWLLGVDWAHLTSYGRVERGVDEGGSRLWSRVEDLRVRSNRGMLGVVPAWRLLTLLQDDTFVKARRQAERDLSARNADSPAELDRMDSQGPAEPAS